jgi:hypothetical protein
MQQWAGLHAMLSCVKADHATVDKGSMLWKLEQMDQHLLLMVTQLLLMTHPITPLVGTSSSTSMLPVWPCWGWLT